LLVIVLAGIFIFNNRKALKAMEASPTSESSLLFTDTEGQPSSIRVVASTGETVELAHDGQGAWVLTAPFRTAADPALAEASASQVATLRVLSDVDLPLDVLGLDKPAYVITIRFTGGAEHTLEVGSQTPTQSGYYVRVDGFRKAIVSASGLTALLTLVASPPYLDTPTPSPAPATPTAVPVTGAAPSPTP
jgi:hypothetical protein